MNDANPKSKTALDYFLAVTDIAPLMSALSRGAIIRKTVSILMQVTVVLMGLYLIYFWFKSWAILKDVRFFTGLAVVQWQLVVPFAGFLSLKLLYLRAADVQALPDSDYVVAPIVSILITVYGEIVFLFLGVMSIPLTVMAWLISDQDLFSFRELTFAPIQTGFWGGLLTFLTCWGIGFLALLLTRFLREWLMAIFSIAQDVHLLRRRGEQPVTPAA